MLIASAAHRREDFKLRKVTFQQWVVNHYFKYHTVAKHAPNLTFEGFFVYQWIFCTYTVVDTVIIFVQVWGIYVVKTTVHGASVSVSILSSIRKYVRTVELFKTVFESFL